MHAEIQPKVSVVPRCLSPVADVPAGQLFVRIDSPHEVLAPMTFAGAEASDADHVWSVVIAVNDDGAGYVPGALLRLPRHALVRRVHEARPAAYALEQ